MSIFYLQSIYIYLFLFISIHHLIEVDHEIENYFQFYNLARLYNSAAQNSTSHLIDWWVQCFEGELMLLWGQMVMLTWYWVGTGGNVISSCVFSLRNTLVNYFQGKPCSSRVRMPCKHLSSLLVLVSSSSNYITVMETSHTLSNHTSKWTQYVAYWDTVLFYRLPSRFGQQIM